jgi:hypothetical protein
MSADDDAALTRFALLEGFFQRTEEAGKLYCADCLVLQLRQRGSPAFSLGSVRAAVEDAFERPGVLHVKPSEPCEVCKKPRRCIGAPRPGLGGLGQEL